MLTIRKYCEIGRIPDIVLRNHIEHRALDLMQENDIADIDEIGCFVILNADEGEQFLEDGMEFVERVVLSGMEYLHGVHILGDCYGEDIYLTITGGENCV